MRFKGKCSIWKQVTHTSAAPKAVDTEFRVFRPNLSTNPDGPPVLECRTKQSTYKYKVYLNLQIFHLLPNLVCPWML